MLTGADSSLALLSVWQEAAGRLKRSAAPIIGYGILFQVVSALTVAPLVAFCLNALISASGRMSVTNTDIAAFLQSAPGLAVAMLAATAALSALYAQCAGFMLIGSAAAYDRRVGAFAALRLMLSRALDLLTVALAQVGIVLVVALPTVGLVLLVYRIFLGAHDINYYLSERPPELMIALAIGGVLLLGLAALLVALYVRWALALPVCLFEGKRFFAALRASHERVRGHGREVALLTLGWLGAVTLSSVLTIWILNGLAGILLAWMPVKPYALIGVGAAVSALTLLTAAAFSLISIAGYSLLAAILYERLGQRRCVSAPEPDWLTTLHGFSRAPVPRPRRLVLGLAAGAYGFMAVGVAYALIENLDLSHPVQVTAHRGSSAKAPENSLSAVRQAIEDGADYAEIDVQETADGTVVVIHDTDLMRVAGLNRKIWGVRYDEIRDLDAGSWFSAKFEGEPIPTLQQVLDLARGRIKLNIELKLNGHEQRLEERVANLIADNGFERDCVVTSLEYSALRKIKRLDEKLRTGHIVSARLGDVTRLEALDFLSLQAGQINETAMRAYRRAGLGVHVWTVNDPRSMLTMIMHRVDNIITDKPELLVALQREIAELGDTELLLLAVSVRLGDFGAVSDRER